MTQSEQPSGLSQNTDIPSWDFVISEFRDVIRSQEILVAKGIGDSDVNQGWLAGLKFALEVASDYESDEWSDLGISQYNSMLQRYSSTTQNGLFLQSFLGIMAKLFFYDDSLEIYEGRNEKFKMGVRLSMFRWIGILPETDLVQR